MGESEEGREGPGNEVQWESQVMKNAVGGAGAVIEKGAAGTFVQRVLKKGRQVPNAKLRPLCFLECDRKPHLLGNILHQRRFITNAPCFTE